MSERTIKMKIAKMKELEEQKKNLEKEMDKLKKDIQKEMDSRDTEELAAGEHIVRWTKVVRNNFDSKAFRTEHPRLYKKFMKPAETRRFSIA